MKKVRLSRGVMLLPSLCTTGSMFFGFFSIIRAINGDYYTAAWAIFCASFFDMIDGRVARMTKTQTDFGKEYDSLVDLASFGLAPAILIYTWTLSSFRPLGWIFSFLFFACVALRLARFNVQIHTLEKNRFQGLPCPPAACLLASVVLFYHKLFGEMVVHSQITLFLVPLLALLMVSNIRYRSFKEYDVKKTNSFYVLIGASIAIGIIAMSPEIVPFAAFSTYAISGPISSIFELRKKRSFEKQKTKTQKLSVVDPKKENEETFRKIS